MAFKTKKPSRSRNPLPLPPPPIEVPVEEKVVVSEEDLGRIPGVEPSDDQLLTELAADLERSVLIEPLLREVAASPLEEPIIEFAPSGLEAPEASASPSDEPVADHHLESNDSIDRLFDPGMISSDPASEFDEHSLTPPAIELPQTRDAIDHMLVELDHLRSRRSSEVDELMGLHAAREESIELLKLAHEKIVDLELQIQHNQEVEASYRNEALTTAERLIDMERRLFESEMRAGDAEAALNILRKRQDKLRTNKIWQVIPRHRKDQPSSTRIYVFAADMQEAIERIVSSKTLALDEISNVSIAIDKLIF